MNRIIKILGEKFYCIQVVVFFIFSVLDIFVTKKLTAMVYENISLKVFTQFLKSQKKCIL